MNSQTADGHTPGPWTAIGSVPSEGFDCFWIKAQPNPLMRGFTKEIATVNGNQSDPAQAGNARLIAAAPELLDALYQYRSDLRYPPAPDSIERRLAMIDKLLAKIEGHSA